MKRMIAVIALALICLLPHGDVAFADAQCWDGMYSAADGLGACSYNGGVQMWLPNGAVNTPVGQVTAFPQLLPLQYQTRAEPKPKPWYSNGWVQLGVIGFGLWGVAYAQEQNKKK